MFKSEVSKKIIPYRVTTVSCEMNLKLEKIVGQILSIMTMYDNSIFRNGDVSPVLFISSHHYHSTAIDVRPEYVTFEMHADGLLVDTMSAYDFINLTDADRHRLSRYSIIIIGFINCIPEAILANIINGLSYQLIYTFGDRLVDSPELGEYAQRMLSTCQFDIRTDSSSDDLVTSKKRLSSLVKKLRERKYSTNGNDDNFDGAAIRNVTDIYTGDVETYLRDGGFVVVPKRFLAQINSIILADTNVGPRVGSTVFNLVPYVYQTDDRKLIIPPMTPITIINVGDTYDSNGGLIKILDIMCDINGVNNVMMGVPVNYTSYLLQFDPNMQINNIEEYKYILSNAQATSYGEGNHDFNFMYIAPYRLMSSNYIKYTEPDNLLCYIESIARSDLYSQDTSYFNSVCRVRNNLNLMFNYEFNSVV